jgi:cupin 2 domain-containing protein
MPITPASIFSGISGSGEHEEFVTLLETSAVRIERIVSHAQSSPDGFWYDQPDDEWVMMLRGRATLEIDPSGPVEMGTGDHVFIPRHTRHRVAATTADTIWLAIHLKSE